MFVVCGQIILPATVKELLKSDSNCESYAEIKKWSSFMTHRLGVYDG